MDKLKAHYGLSLRKRRKIFEQLLPVLEKDASAQKAARENAHALKGSGATYGFPELSRVAARAEKAVGQELLAAVQELVDAMLAAIRQCPAPEALGAEKGES